VTRAVLLAGGRGTRLAPYTSVLPKPLMPIGDQSILEIVVRQLTRSGITDVTMCVGYLSRLIEAIFAGEAWQEQEIRFVREREPLGTAAPLRLVDGLTDTFLVMNGDVLSSIDYAALIDEHRTSGNRLTIAGYSRRTRIDFGVLRLQSSETGQRLVAYDEKPALDLMVSTGIYVMEPEVLAHISPDGYFDFPDLVQALLEAGEPVGVHLHDGFWLDIGRHEDYQQAIDAWESGRLSELAITSEVPT
jgi:NDP-mannose synthase